MSRGTASRGWAYSGVCEGSGGAGEETSWWSRPPEGQSPRYQQVPKAQLRAGHWSCSQRPQTETRLPKTKEVPPPQPPKPVGRGGGTVWRSEAPGGRQT